MSKEADQIRRALVAAVAVGAGPWRAMARAVDVTESIADLENRSGGRLGVYARDLTSNRTLAHRPDERFKLQSSFKGLLTAMVLHQVALGRDDLDAPVRYGKADLVDPSPVTSKYVDAGRMSVGQLCAATMATSDNAAANLLMRRLGGPAALTAFLRSIGDHVTRVDNYEGEKLANAPLPADSTTPVFVIQTIERILLGDVLTPTHRSVWEDWMGSNLVGRTRLRATFPSDWRSGDRTGTYDGICNDYAFAMRPGRQPLLVAAYYSAPGMQLTRQEAVLREVGRLVVEWQR